MRGVPIADIRAVPKIDLHRHLLGSMRPQTLWELSRRYDLKAGKESFEAFRNNIVHSRPTLDLARYIQPWQLFREAVRTPDDVRRIAREAADDARLDGVRYVEFRSSLPGLPVTDGQSPQTRIPTGAYLQAIREGFSEAPGITCRLVASIPRHAVGSADPLTMMKYGESLIGAIEKFRELIVGVDLTGIETGWPARLFRNLFVELRAAGLSATVHAGETEGPGEIWSAIRDLEASRIGHGTSAPSDPALVEELIRRKVVLEVCPTASWLVGTSQARGRHQVIDCKPSIPFAICTDNPLLNASTLSQELSLGAQIAGLDLMGFLESQCRVAANAAFDKAALAAAGVSG